MQVTILAESFMRRFRGGRVGMLVLTKKVILAVRPTLVAGVALGAISAMIPMRSGLTQTLDDAVNEQLASPGGANCVVLLGGQDPFTELTGTLQQICTIAPGAAPPPSSATGGGAGTPATLPGIVQKRLRESRSEEKEPEKKLKKAGAGVDAVVKLGSRLNIFYSGEYKRSGWNVTTFEDGYNSNITQMTASADYKFTDRVGRRSEEKRPSISKVSQPGSRIVLMSQPLNPLTLLQAQQVMGVSSDATNRNHATIEIAMGPLRVMGIEIQEATADSAIIQIQADQAVVNYKTFILSDPQRIVIDFEGALLAEPMLREKVGKGPIKQIRASQFRHKPEPVVRVVLDLATALPYQVAGLPDTFLLLIGEAVAKAEAIEVPEITKDPFQVTDVTIQEATANSAIIRIQADQPVDRYNTFLLSDPPRIVIDIAGALLGEPMLREKAGKGPIKQIRASQFHRKPEPVVRVVLDLVSSLPYQVAGLPDTFQLLIGEAVAKADQVKSVVPPPVTAEKPKAAPEEKPLSAEPQQLYQRNVGLWGGGEYEDLDRDRTTFEDGYDSDIWRVTIGADYQFTDRIMAGLAFDYYRHDGDFDGGGGFTNDSYGLLAYSTFFPMDQVFIQVVAGYSYKDNERKRIASWEQDGILVTGGSIDGDYNGNEYRLGALAGYDLPVNNITISPRVGLDWRRTEFDSFKEKGRQTRGELVVDVPVEGSTGLELRFDDDDQTSLQSRIGVQTSMALRTRFGMVVPQASFDWMHEFDNDQRNVTVSFAEDLRAKQFTYETDNPDRDWFEINAGVVTALPIGLQVFCNYRTIVGHSFLDSHAGMIGLRYTF